MDVSNKRVIFITGALTGGGAERVLSILASTAADMGAQVEVVILRDRKRSYSLSENVICHQLKPVWKHGRAIERILQLRRIFKASSATAIIPFLPIITLYALIANIGVGKKIVMSERADPRKSVFSKGLAMKDRVGNLLMRRVGLYNLADWMVFQTPDAQSYYGKRLQQKSCVIPNPLDTDALPARFEGEREKRIVAAGRFSDEKNFPMLLRGFAEFRKNHPDYRLTLYGEGGLRGELENLAKELGVAESVDMPGFADNLQQQMVNAAMYVSTSNHEGISNSMLEALGMGVPTIVTDCPVGGARMFVRTDENGVLIPMEDVQALTDAMNRIADDPEYAVRISRNATAIREELDAKNISRRWLELVEE